MELEFDFRGGKRILWILIQCLTNRARRSRSGPPISFRYLPTALYPVGSTHGPTTGTTKILRKVLSDASSIGRVLLTFGIRLVRRGVYPRYLGLGTPADPFPKRDLGSFIGRATTPRKDRFLHASFGIGRHRPLVPAAFASENFPFLSYSTVATYVVSLLVRNIWKI